jgi:hypothetical protein
MLLAAKIIEFLFEGHVKAIITGMQIGKIWLLLFGFFKIG